MSAVLRDPRAWPLLVAASLTIMSNATLTPALPGLARLFADTPHAELLTRLLITAPSLTAALSAPLVGWMADRHGRRPLLLAGVALFAIAGSAGLVLPNLPAILLSRGLVGVAVAMIITAQSALIGDYFDGPVRARFMGSQMGATHLGGFLFVLLAGIVAAQSPRLPFALYALPLLLLPWFGRVLKEARRGETMVGGPAPLAGAWDWRVVVAGVLLATGTGMAIVYLVPTELPFALSARGLGDPVVIGRILSLAMLIGGVLALQVGNLQRLVGPIATLGLGALSMAIGLRLVATSHSAVWLTLGAGLMISGFTIASPGLGALVLQVTPLRRRGLAMGLFTTALFVGQFVSPLLAHPVIAAQGHAATFQQISLALAMTGVLTLLAAIRTRRAGRAAG